MPLIVISFLVMSQVDQYSGKPVYWANGQFNFANALIDFTRESIEDPYSGKPVYWNKERKQFEQAIPINHQEKPVPVNGQEVSAIQEIINAGNERSELFKADEFFLKIEWILYTACGFSVAFAIGAIATKSEGGRAAYITLLLISIATSGFLYPLSKRIEEEVKLKKYTIEKKGSESKKD